MKVLLLCALLVVGTQGSFFGDMGKFFTGVGNSLAHTFGGVLADLKDPINNLGSTIIKNMTASGKNLLNEGLQALVVNSLNNINANKGKRLISGFTSRLSTVYEKVSHGLESQELALEGLFKDTISKITNEVKPKATIKNAKKTVNTLVSDFKRKSNLIVKTMMKELESTLRRGVDTKITGIPAVHDLAMRIKSKYEATLDDLNHIVQETAKVAIKEITKTVH